MSQGKVNKYQNNNAIKKEVVEMTDEETIEIKKKELLEYAERMVNVKDLHKKRSVEAKAEVLELRDQNSFMITEFRKIRDKYNDTAKELKELQDIVKNKKVHRVNNFNDIAIGNLEDEIKQVDEEAKKMYEEKSKKRMEEFKKRLLE